MYKTYTHTQTQCERGRGWVREVSNRKRCSAFIFIGIFIWLTFCYHSDTSETHKHIRNTRVDSMILLHCINTHFFDIFAYFYGLFMQRSNFIAFYRCCQLFLFFTHTHTQLHSQLAHPFTRSTKIHTCIGHTFVDEKFIDIFRYWLFCLLHIVRSLPVPAFGMWNRSSTVSIIFYSFRTRTHFQSKNLIIYKFCWCDYIFQFSFSCTRDAMHWCLQSLGDWKCPCPEGCLNIENVNKLLAQVLWWWFCFTSCNGSHQQWQGDFFSCGGIRWNDQVEYSLWAYIFILLFNENIYLHLKCLYTRSYLW